jgi:light-regulated signal transduction histidine kinase (bacteriophytochrome)
MKYLVLKNSTEIIYSSNVTKDFKDLHYAPGFKAIAGVLFIPLSPTGAADCLVLYRKNQVKEVHWAGRPSSLSGGPEVLEPRSSFRIWTQRVDGSSRAWTTDQGKPIDFVQARFLFLLLLLLFLVVRD